MTFSRFCDALSITLDGGCSEVTVHLILHLCRNFVILDGESDLVRFAHLSVREFLEEKEEYSDDSNNLMAAKACLLHLVQWSKRHYFAALQSPFVSGMSGQGLAEESSGSEDSANREDDTITEPQSETNEHPALGPYASSEEASSDLTRNSFERLDHEFISVYGSSFLGFHGYALEWLINHLIGANKSLRCSATASSERRFQR